MVAESVKVIVRCRPMNQREKDLSCKSVLKIDSLNAQCSLFNVSDDSLPPKSFTFDGAYDTHSQTEVIYNEIGFPVVEGVTEGYNGTIFAYGQTGCGKSFTMQGIENDTSQKGIIPRAFDHVFEAIATSENSKYLVHCSYLEIYNEEIRDLLGKDNKKKLDLKEHPEKGVYIPGLSVHAVHNVKECEEIMKRGWSNRSVGATLMNADSSRSHSIFTIFLETMHIRSDGQEHIRKGKLNLVDLAGSERQAKTGATGDRLKEATKINLSLSALGNVISALVDGKSKHIPYRDSKLTRLLQDSLGGNTKTLMIACLSPADNNYDETLSTLRYANRAKNIKNKPKINEDPKDALLREYQQEIERLKVMLDGKSSHIPVNNKENVEKMQQDYNKEMAELKENYEREQKNKAKLLEDMENLKKLYESKAHQDQNNPVISANGETQGQNNSTNMNENFDQTEALKRLKQLEQHMVGGEKVNDKALKEKRAKRKKVAERKILALAAALAKAEEGDDTKMLDVYDSIQEEVRVKNELLKKYRRKVREMSQEITDIQSEFEFDRMDYLETIRRQDQQIKLVQQILDKIQPCLRRDSNYSNLEKVKKECKWDEDTQRWKLPELEILRTVLPATGIHPGGRAPIQPAQPNAFDDQDEDKFLKRLERSEKEDIAGNYFRPKKNAKVMKRNAPSDLNGNSFRSNQLSNSFNGGLSLSSSAPAHLNGSTTKETRKPMRLEALNVIPSNDFSKLSPKLPHKIAQAITSTNDST